MNVRKRKGMGAGNVSQIHGSVNAPSKASDSAKGIKNAVGAQPAKHVCVMGGVGMGGMKGK